MVEKWRKWVIQMQPYKNDGTLRACWIWKHDQAMKAKETDLVVLREFGWHETFKCCLYCVNTWLATLWPALGVVVLSPELFAFGLAVAFSFYFSSATISRCVIFLAVVSLYLFFWFNYS